MTKGIHYYAIRHDVTGQWMCEGPGQICGWTSDLWMALVWQPDDMDDEDLQALPTNCHWEAFTWERYCANMAGVPPVTEWMRRMAAQEGSTT
jgi:hypothetical protein